MGERADSKSIEILRGLPQLEGNRETGMNERTKVRFLIQSMSKFDASIGISKHLFDPRRALIGSH